MPGKPYVVVSRDDSDRLRARFRAGPALVPGAAVPLCVYSSTYCPRDALYLHDALPSRFSTGHFLSQQSKTGALQCYSDLFGEITSTRMECLASAFIMTRLRPPNTHRNQAPGQ
ncbi:hypothetical protein XA68_18283 [Ophiocordyceps unilateralis]|uniref:Uncharacterized protein n=1 Tax=Ophiocordyceps unilateralis TaxID=268505 RepID=A0A2A9PHU9_OPHUN|nr:hypothetical protein XA68_18283 [Ophiocordyceps unilateralis]